MKALTVRRTLRVTALLIAASALALLFGASEAGATGLPQIDAGAYHTCAVQSDGTLTCWGDNSYGQSTPPAGTFTSVSSGFWHSCAVRTDGSVACWGWNGYGQTSPPAGTFKAVTAGYAHTCAVRADNAAVCWGGYGYGTSPPSGAFSDVASGNDFSCGVRTTGALTCWGYNHPDGNSLFHPSGTFASVEVGMWHSCAVRTDASAACWGLNNNGQSTAAAGSFTSASAGAGNSCGVRTNATLACWGGIAPPPAGTFDSVSSGYNHACAVRTDGTIVCWGSNPNGQTDVPVPVNAPPEVALSGPSTATEGTIESYTFDTTDPDSDSFTLDESTCGDSGSIVDGSVVFTAATGDGSISCSFADDTPTATSSDTSTVGVTISDDLASDSATFDVTVSNVAPSVVVTSPIAGALVPAGSTNVTATFSDPGKLDSHTCTINGAVGAVAYTPAGSGTGTCTGSVALAPGTNTIEVEVCDDDSGCDADSVTLSALYAIYAHEQCSGGAGKGLSVNGANAYVGGSIHANGNLKIDGSNFTSGTASLFRPQSGCSTSYDPSKVNFGPPSPSAPVEVAPAGSWPLALSRSEFACTQPIKDEYVFNTAGQTIPGGVYCATKTFKINANNVTGNITVLAPEIVINGKNVRLTPHTNGVLLYNVNLDGSPSSKEIVLDADFTADTTAVLSGLIHNPGGGIKVNGKSVRLTRGFLQALWVEINLDGFRMEYSG